MAMSIRTPIGRAGMAALVAAVAVVGPLVPAAADVDYTPQEWNGKRIYLSQACHDGNDGVPGGSCITNHGCAGYSENAQSYATALHAINGVRKDQLNLLERGYRVRRGTGTLNENVNSSNNYGADLHIPIHSNARSETCEATAHDKHGTLMLYVSEEGRACSDEFLRWFGPGSPGSNDVRRFHANLGELNSTTAVACYLEMEFHTWKTGRDWLLREEDYAWRIAGAIDAYLEYP